MASNRRSHEAGASKPARKRRPLPRDRQQAQVSAVLHGNLLAEIGSNAGARIDRVSLRQAADDLLSRANLRHCGNP